jgi:hypothetical protein
MLPFFKEAKSCCLQKCYKLLLLGGVSGISHEFYAMTCEDTFGHS